MICNQAESFSRCLFKVQQSMQEQLKAVRTERKGEFRRSYYCHGRTAEFDELQLKHHPGCSKDYGASHRVCIHIHGKFNLAGRDAYLTHLKSGIKLDTVASIKDSSHTYPNTFLGQYYQEGQRRGYPL